MKVKLTRDFKFIVSTETSYTFRAGITVDGDVAEAAIREGAAEAPKKKRTPRPKVTKPTGPTQEG